MSRHGFHAVSMREIASEAGVHLGSVTYYFKTKANLLSEIYQRHSRPMNQRRVELLNEAERIKDPVERLSAIIRAFAVPAFSSNVDSVGGGARFTRLRAILSMEGNEIAKKIIATTFDDTTHTFMNAIARCLPKVKKADIIWRCHFLLGSLYYTLVNGERIDRLSDGKCRSGDQEMAVNQLVTAMVASLLSCDKGYKGKASMTTTPAAMRKRA